VRFSAARSPGIIFGGHTSQGEPAVVRVDAKHRMVSNVLATWRTSSCTPAAAFRYPDAFQNFRMKSTGAFGGSFTDDASFNDGTKRHFAFTLAGRVLKTKVTGSLRVTFNDTDATGAQTLACDSGGITFKATTG
jgi:hypothetical protein